MADRFGIKMRKDCHYCGYEYQPGETRCPKCGGSATETIPVQTQCSDKRVRGVWTDGKKDGVVKLVKGFGSRARFVPIGVCK